MKCYYCGNVHEIKCPLISAYDYTKEGKVKRIEFVTFADIATPTSIFDLMPTSDIKN